MTAEKHLEERRRDILAAAQTCFDTNGYAATTMEAVAERAGISKGSIYNYFSSKMDLFRQLFASSMAGTEADFDRMTSQPIRAADKLNLMLDYWSAMLEQHTRIGGLVLDFWAAAARQGKRNEFSSWFSQTHGNWRNKLTAVIAEGIKSGDFREGFDPEIAASIILAVLHGFTVQAILDESMKVNAEFLAALKRAILIAMTAQPAQKEE